MSITIEQANRYNKRFSIEENPLNAFEKILDFSLKDRDSSLFTQDDFFDHLYFVNTSITRAKEQIIQFIVSNQRYILLHSYGRNGKSSFLNYLEYKSEEFENET